MTKRLIIIIILFISCNQTNENKAIEKEVIDPVTTSKEMPIAEPLKKEDFKAMSNDSLWHYLIFEKGGCLTGGQYNWKGKFGNEGCVMTRNKEWDIFTKRNKTVLTDFLILKLPSTDTTNIHTCPFFVATEGETAVYTLHKIHGKNWYDFKYFSQYKTRETTSSLDSRQTWLQDVLGNKKDRNKLIAYWRKEI